jgi:hypothetical protein
LLTKSPLRWLISCVTETKKGVGEISLIFRDSREVSKPQFLVPFHFHCQNSFTATMTVPHWISLLGFISSFYICSGFTTTGNPIQRNNGASSMQQLLAGLFGGDSDILKNMPGKKPDGPKVVMDIPVETIKPGPLRFFLQIYIVGQQNSQDSQSWLPRESDDGGLQVCYKDGTGMCNISLESNNIKVERHGQRPSLQYMLQESVLLHGVLDELTKVAFEVEDVDESKQLLVLEESAIDKAQELLPARQE